MPAVALTFRVPSGALASLLLLLVPTHSALAASRVPASGCGCGLAPPRSLGCFGDPRGQPNGERCLPFRFGAYPDFTANNTPSLCSRLCAEDGWTGIMGVESSSGCWCSNYTVVNDTLGACVGPPNATNCDFPCAGDPTLVCGGNWHVELFDQACTPCGPGPGFFVLLAFGSAVVAYILVGAIVVRAGTPSASARQIWAGPHADKWAQLPGLVLDGVQFTFCCAVKRARQAAGYGEYDRL